MYRLYFMTAKYSNRALVHTNPESKSGVNTSQLGSRTTRGQRGRKGQRDDTERQRHAWVGEV